MIYLTPDYSALFENVPIGLAAVSTDGVFLTTNQALAGITGYSSTELIGRHFKSITAEPDQSVSNDFLLRMRRGELAEFDLEKRYVHKAGHLIWIRLRARTMRGADGEITYFLSSFEDISARKLLEESVRQNEQKYRRAIATTPAGFMIVDREGQIVEANAAYCRLTGHATDEVVGRLVSDFDLDSTPEGIRARINDLPSEGYSQFEVRHRRSDGTSIPFTVSASWDSELGCSFAFLHDLTTTRLLSAQLSQRFELMQALINGIPDAVIMKDTAGRWQAANAAALSLIGLGGKGAVADLRWLNLTDQELIRMVPEAGEVHAALTRNNEWVWTIREPYAYRTRVRLPGGQERAMEIRKIPAFDDHGQDRMMISLVRDITANETATRRLIEQDQQIRQGQRRLEAVERMLINISEYTLEQIGQELHDDLGQLLTGASLLIGAIRKQGKLETQNDGLMHSLQQLLNQAIAKTRTISHGLYPEPFDEIRHIDLVSRAIENQQAFHGPTIDFDHDGCSLVLDNQQALDLFRILQELFSNVRRHSRATHVAVRSICQEGKVTLELIDNGIGIKVDSDGSGDSTDPGMGLRSMALRAERIGALLEVAPATGGGTRAVITLPFDLDALPHYRTTIEGEQSG